MVEAMNEDLARIAYETYKQEMEKRPYLMPTFMWKWEDHLPEYKELWRIVAEKVKQHG